MPPEAPTDRLPEHPLFARLFDRTTAGIRPGLEVVERLLAGLENPHLAVPALHVAGTNGKGSVCARAEASLRHAGLRTFLYTSPHLVHYRERFRLEGVPVADDPLVAAIERVLAVDERRTADARAATFFEVSTAAAFLLAAESGAEVSVIETGLGGRWDATRPCRAEACAITRIDLDHQEFLGTDLVSIAGEKAGILRPGIPAVSAPQYPKVEQVLRDEATRLEVPLSILPAAALPDWQAENRAVADSLVSSWAHATHRVIPPLPPDHMVPWPGRFQSVCDQPPTWVDGAHNPAAAQAVAATMRAEAGARPVGVMLGMLADKAGAEMLAGWRHTADQVFPVHLSHRRGADAATWAEWNGDSVPRPLAQAWSTAKEWAQRENGVVLITGSLYLVGEALAERPWKTT